VDWQGDPNNSGKTPESYTMDPFFETLKKMEGSKLVKVTTTGTSVTQYFERGTFTWHMELADKANINAPLKIVEDVNATTPFSLDARVFSMKTAEELLSDYRTVCGALNVAAEHAVEAIAGDDYRAAFSEAQRKQLVINKWLIEAQDKYLLAKMGKTEMVQ
jgi:hypothetical protein